MAALAEELEAREQPLAGEVPPEGAA